MRRKALFSVAALIGAAGSALAQTAPPPVDPLHGFCNTVTCADQNLSGGTVTSGTGFNASDFGFTISPGPQGKDTFAIIIAEPTDETAGGNILTGTINGTAIAPTTLSQLTGTGLPWTANSNPGGSDIGDLVPVQTLLPGGVTPTNPFGNFSPFTASVDPTFSGGYDLYAAVFDDITLQDNSAAGPSAMDLSVGIPIGSMIFGFFENQPTPQAAWAGTASSGVLFADSPDAPSVPEPSSLLILGAALTSLGLMRKRSR